MPMLGYRLWNPFNQSPLTIFVLLINNDLYFAFEQFGLTSTVVMTYTVMDMGVLFPCHGYGSPISMSWIRETFLVMDTGDFPCHGCGRLSLSWIRETCVSFMFTDNTLLECPSCTTHGLETAALQYLLEVLLVL